MFVNLRCISLAEVRYGLKGWDADIIKKRLLNAHSWLLKSDSFSNDVKDEATSRCLVDM